MTARVGFVGVGRMGAPMAGLLVRCGWDVTVWDVRPRAAAEVVGARAAGSLGECVRGSDVLVTMLPGVAEVREVLLGEVLAPAGAASLRPGSLVIDMGTGSPSLAREVAGRAAASGVDAVDAPVAGAGDVAEGRLRIYAGGSAEAVERARPLLEVLGDPARIVHCGPAGTGQAVKLLVNLLWFANAAVASEALLAGARAGVELETLHGALADGPGGSAFLREEAVEVLDDGSYAEQFPLRLVVEELSAACGIARDAGVPAPVAEAVEQVHRRALDRLGADAGEVGVVRLYEELAGMPLRFDAESRAHAGPDAPEPPA